MVYRYKQCWGSYREWTLFDEKQHPRNQQNQSSINLLVERRTHMRSFTRYQQSPISQSYLELKTKQMATPKVTHSNSQHRNPENQLLRLPALNSMRRSSSIASTDRNTKFKLQNLDEKLEELAANVHNTRMEAQETINHIRYLKQNLGGVELGRVKQDLKKQAKGLQRFVHSTITADQQRSQIIKDDCSELWSQTENLRQQLFDLSMRIQKLDLQMGFKNN